jgi:antitoxin ParD1/3/4
LPPKSARRSLDPIDDLAESGGVCSSDEHGIHHRCSAALWHIMPIVVPSQEIAMPTRNVVLTDHQAELVEQLVASGRYQNASEVLREGLRLVEGREAEDKARLKALREAARLGIADMQEGRFHSFASADAIRSHLNGIADEAISAKASQSTSK